MTGIMASTVYTSSFTCKLLPGKSWVLGEETWQDSDLKQQTIRPTIQSLIMLLMCEMLPFSSGFNYFCLKVCLKSNDVFCLSGNVIKLTSSFLSGNQSYVNYILGCFVLVTSFLAKLLCVKI